ncbi:leucine zipper domain-containing protein, partial [Streptomyces sp. NPDC020875]|uniref:leucine zipper domain-containing protein n=1 Tax=Streptomyces sp. NPDC020875 TaxID=3154898 RepID=UPI00340B978A
MAKTSGVVEVSRLHTAHGGLLVPNARLTVHGRRILVERVLAGRPVAHVAAEMGI